MDFLFNVLDLPVAKKFFSNKGFVGLDRYFLENEVNEIKKAVAEVKSIDGVDLYLDRSNLMRRMENFIFKNNLLVKVNSQIVDLLSKLTSKDQNLFKDKVNFKPPNGEGFNAHYDGIFQFKTKEGILKNGWYEYASEFNTVLICLDDFTTENGTLEISMSHPGNFNSLLRNTKGNGSPDLKDNLVKDLNFYPVLAKAGSLIIFKHNCPHRSFPNFTSNDRSSLYLTYNNSKDGNFYEEYFQDKKNSTNTNKALLGEQVKNKKN